MYASRYLGDEQSDRNKANGSLRWDGERVSQQGLEADEDIF